MWTEQARIAHKPREGRYPSDLTDAEWSIVEGMIPPPRPGGRRRWVVERTLSWLRRNRRLMAHYEALAIIAEGFAKLVMITATLRRLTEPNHQTAT